MSLRSWRSWMPARKSCASRIMGERLVRAMAVSTSISTLASVPCTISTRIGSTVVPLAVSRFPCSYAVGRPAGFTGASAVWVWAVVTGAHGRSGLLGDDEVADRVDANGEAGVDGHGRAELLDDGRPAEGVAGAQVGRQ